MSYYQKWLPGLERLMLDAASSRRMKSTPATPLHPAKPVARTLTRRRRCGHAASRRTDRRDAKRRPASPGDRVRTKDIHPATHTRLPRYVRGHVGMVEMRSTAVMFFRTRSDRAGENPQWLYTVVFDGRELWGADADPTVKISIDAFEPYLEPA